jgi:CheY-like chemotaxis protein
VQTSTGDANVLTLTIQPKQHLPGHHGHVLLVCEFSGVEKLADSIAAQMNVCVDVAVDGLIACHLARKATVNGTPYDLILMDTRTPDRDGIEAAQWLRRNHWNGPIVVVSDRADHEDRHAYLTAGCDDFLAKPLNNEILHSMLECLTERYACLTNILSWVREQSAVVNLKSTLHGRILIVEDAHCSQRILAAFLKRWNLEFDVAGDGQRACEMAAQSQKQGTPYDVILMDMQMPKMNGKQATTWLRNNGWLKTIIALSAHSTETDHEDFLRSGCNDFLSKPISESSLQSMLSKYLATQCESAC